MSRDKMTPKKSVSDMVKKAANKIDMTGNPRQSFMFGAEMATDIVFDRVVEVMKKKMNDDGYIDIWTDWIIKNKSKILKGKK